MRPLKVKLLAEALLKNNRRYLLTLFSKESLFAQPKKLITVTFSLIVGKKLLPLLSRSPRILFFYRGYTNYNN